MRQKALDIGVDLMGSDNAPFALIDSILQFAHQTPQVHFHLFGTEDAHNYFNHRKNNLNVHFVNVAQTIEMDENPLLAIRQKKDSSICVSMRFLKQGKISALVSCGNTGALVFAAKTILGMQKNILRPALLAWLPTKKNPLAILDVGANVSVKPIHLVQFAKMAITLSKTKNIKQPRVGLLNIGSEKLKGTTLLKETYQELILLKDTWKFDFKGNIEGKDVFKGDVDILITDGFTGNIFLKTAEGVASLILDRLNEKIPQEISNTLTPYLKDLKSHLHYAQYPGAILIGVNGLVIKCHGYSSPKAFINGIKDAICQKKSKKKNSFFL